MTGEDFRTRAALERVAATHGLDAGQTEALSAYVELLLGWRRANVTGLTDPVAVVDTLIGDSLALLTVPELNRRREGALLDLGAGAGIPGIPLAVSLPAATVTLLDAVAKKCAFLEAAVAAAGLSGRASIVCARSERHSATGAPGREAYTVVLARAVAELAVLVELAAPLLAQDGVLLASKTRRALEREGDAAAAAAERCGLIPEPPVLLSASPLDEAVCAVYRKVEQTADWLPRREGMAAKRPLIV
jgi:16S rRNA (guanine527-N7)-methyltransferase